MRLKVDDWEFDVDMTRTMAYSAEEAATHCTCGDCLNFYAAIDGEYPYLRPFLAQFGIDISAPEQMSPISISKDRIDYDPSYIVYGRIIHRGSYEMAAGRANILADGEDGEDHFWLHTYEVTLPWVLDEPFEESAPDKGFGLFQRIFKKEERT